MKGGMESEYRSWVVKALEVIVGSGGGIGGKEGCIAEEGGVMRQEDSVTVAKGGEWSSWGTMVVEDNGKSMVVVVVARVSFDQEVDDFSFPFPTRSEGDTYRCTIM